MLTLQFIPFQEIERLDSNARVEKLLKIVKEEKIILLEGSIKPEEQSSLIQRTMEDIDDKFKGIEISPIHFEQKEDKAFIKKIKERVLNLLLGDRKGFTIIGPATVVKEIKKDPDKIQLFTEDSSNKTSSKTSSKNKKNKKSKK